jgi:hypothetical protein
MAREEIPDNIRRNKFVGVLADQELGCLTLTACPFGLYNQIVGPKKVNNQLVVFCSQIGYYPIQISDYKFFLQAIGNVSISSRRCIG